jgi:hypothetical protein
MRVALLLTLVVAGCSSEVAAPPRTCAERLGIYQVTWNERSGGTCGPQQTQLVDFNGKTTCDNSDLREVNAGCGTEGTLVCGDLRGVTTCKWSVDGRSGTCVTSISGACSSTYDLRYAKQ